MPPSAKDVPFTHKDYSSKKRPSVQQRPQLRGLSAQQYWETKWRQPIKATLTAEWAAELSRGAHIYRELVDPDLAESAFKYSQAVRGYKDLGQTAEQAAKSVWDRSFRLSGSAKNVVLATLYRGQVPAGIPNLAALQSDPGLYARFIPEFLDPAGLEHVMVSESGPSFISRWNKEALANKLAASTVHNPFFAEHFAKRASAAGIGDIYSEYLEYQSQFAPKAISSRVATSIERGQTGTTILEEAKALGRSRWGRLGIAGAAAVLGVNLLFSGSDDDYNTLEAMPHTGMAGERRPAITDFGSGYRGLPASLMGIPIDSRILEFRADVWDSESARAEVQQTIKERSAIAQAKIGVLGPSDLFSVDLQTIEGMNDLHDGMKAVRLSRFAIDVEDADTIMLRRRGVVPWLKSTVGMGEEVVIRLAGIDAPEVAGHANDPLAPFRIFQNQPHGEAAAWQLKSILQEQDELSLVVAENQKTYGRYLGALVGEEGMNINLELLRKGAVSALPFGPSRTDVVSRRAAEQAEGQAVASGTGMWSYSRYQAAKIASREIGRVTTHNTLTRLDKLGANLNLGAYGSFLAEMGAKQQPLSVWERKKAKQIGRALKRTHGPRKFGPNSSKFSGRDDNYLKVEGLRHEGIAWKKRRALTAFGSGAIDVLFGGMAQFMKMSKASVEKRVSSFLKTVPVEPGVPSVSAIKNPESLKKLFQINIDPESIQEPLRSSFIAHEISEYQLANKIVGKHVLENRAQVAKSVSPSFGSHLGVDPIIDEMFIAAKTGNFEEVKKFRFDELDNIERIIAESKDPLYRAEQKASIARARLQNNMKFAKGLEQVQYRLNDVAPLRSKAASKLWEYRKSLREYKESGGSMNPLFWRPDHRPPQRPSLSMEATYYVNNWKADVRELSSKIVPVEPTAQELGQEIDRSLFFAYESAEGIGQYARRTRKIVNSIEQKWLPRIRGFQTENTVKGLSEGIAAKASRKTLDIPFESPWIRRALKMGMSVENVASAARVLGDESARVVEAEGAKWFVGKQLGSGGFGKVFKAIEGGTGKSGIYKHIGKVQKIASDDIIQPGGPIFQDRLQTLMDKLSLEDMMAKKGPFGELLGAQEELGEDLVKTMQRFGGLGAPHEGAMQKAAFLERKGKNVPEFFGLEKGGEGFFMESAGRPLKPGAETEKALEFLEKEFNQMWMASSEEGTTQVVRHFDPSVANIMIKGNEMMLIDFGLAAQTTHRPSTGTLDALQDALSSYAKVRKKEAMAIGQKNGQQALSRNSKGGKNHAWQQGKRPGRKRTKTNF